MIQNQIHAGLKWAIEGRKAFALAGLYAEDAIVKVIDRDNPPSYHAASKQ